MTQLTGLCIGAGYFAQYHVEAWSRMPEVRIAAICDPNTQKAQALADQYGISRVYSSVEDMLAQEQADFLDIITPPETHLKLCKMAIDRGLHIICQKPLAPTYAESEAIAQAVAASHIRMMVHENFRFQPWHREIKKLVDQGVIGEQLYALNFRMRMGDGWQEDAYMNRQPYFRKMERLLIYETGIHFIDTFRYLGGEISRVYARLKTLNPNIKGEDFAWVHFDFANGMTGFLDASRYHETTVPDPRLTFGSLHLEGARGRISLNGTGQITVHRLGEAVQVHDYAYENRNFSGDCVYVTQRHFVARMLDGQPFETDVADYLQNIKVQDAVYAAGEREEVVRVGG